MSALQIATRGSKLALWQAHHVQGRLRALGQEAELLVLKTTGDRVLDRPLAEVGGKGLFTKEIEEALLDGRARVAVHSMKDLPVITPEGLRVGAVPERADPRDALLLAPGLRGAIEPTLAALPRGARVGTSSLRRLCLLRDERPDLQVVPLRGNVDTRVGKLEAGELDAVVLAAAGLTRLGYGERIDATLDPQRFIPAVGQGALAIQCREDDAEVRALLAQLDDAATHLAVLAERALLARLEGSCRTPIGGHAVLRGGELWLRAFLGIEGPQGARILRAEGAGSIVGSVVGSVAGSPAEAERIGDTLARDLLSQRA